MGIRLIKGSHIIVPKVHQQEYSYILQNKDGRIVFVIPYLDKYSLIGTTDVEYKGDPREVKIDDEEVNYLVDVVNQHFRNQLSKEQIIASFSGVRPLCDDESDSPQAITRDYTLTLQHNQQTAPLLSVFGGKLTTYRKLANAAMEKLKPIFPHIDQCTTGQTLLPGAEGFDREQLTADLIKQMPFLEESLIKRWVEAYGTRALNFTNSIKSKRDLGLAFSESLFKVEVDYLMDVEFVLTAEDLLKRRTKLYLEFTDNQTEYLDTYLREIRAAIPKGSISDQGGKLKPVIH